MTLNMVDVSGYQPANIGDLIKGENTIIVKASEGVHYVNPYLARQFPRSAVGGLYHFSDGGDPIQEAEHFIAVARPFIGHAVLALDLEAGAVAKWGDNGSLAFLKHVQGKTGVTPGIYTSASVTHLLPKVHANGFWLWVAKYGSNAPMNGFHPPADQAFPPWVRAHVWQYTSQGHLPGYSGPLDLDVAYMDMAHWQAMAKPKVGVEALAPLGVKDAGKAAKPNKRGETIYVVRYGDTMRNIMRRFGLDSAKVRALNPHIKFPYAYAPYDGEKIRIK